MKLSDNLRVIPWVELTFEFHLGVKLKFVFEKVFDSGHVRLDKEHQNGQPALAGSYLSVVRTTDVKRASPVRYIPSDD